MDKSRISGYQFMFCIAFFLQSSSLLTSFLSGVSKQDSWFAVLLSSVLCIPLILVYRSLMLTFPQKNFLQMLTTVFGPVAGKILGALFLWFLLTLAALNLKDLGNFTKIMVLESTPYWVLTLMCILLSAWVVRYGLKILGRYAGVLTILEIILVIVTITLVSNQINPKNFLPMFQLPLMKYVQSTHIISCIPLGELVVFLMMTPCVEMSRRETGKFWFGGMAIGISTMLITLLRDISVLGSTMPLFALPGLVTLRLVNLGEVLSRAEALFAGMLIILLFYKVTVLLYVSTIAVAQLMNARAYKHLALVVGVFLVVYCLTLYPSTVVHAISAQTIVPFIWTIFQVIMPLCTLIVAKFRGLTPAGAMAKG